LYARGAYHAAAVGRSASPLDSIMSRAHIVAGLGLLLSSAVAASSGADSTLRSLAKDFSDARSMPLGSRPGPPGIELGSLKGVSSSAIRTALGQPDHGPANPDCHAELCWSFTYGPGAAPLQGSVDNGDGTISVEVSTGGPWLLVLEFTGDRLTSAFWRGQR
jgi:hypothetical protein